MKRESHLLLFLSLLWALLLLILGGWWFYLMHQLGQGHILPTAKLTRMLRWEGTTFVGLLLLLSATLMILYWRDIKKAKALQTFFASLTHELKTPLASVRLQSEVIHDLGQNTKMINLTTRLIEDTKNLERQMDKILQLSRMELGGNLSLELINIASLIKNILPKIKGEIPLHLKCEEREQNALVFLDRFALELILLNMIENSARYNSHPNIVMELKINNKILQLNYSDGGNFQGEVEKIGKLFFKHTTKSGSGIGFYLIKKLMLKMNGNLEIVSHPLKITLTFPLAGREM